MSGLILCGINSLAVAQTITFSPEDFGSEEWSLRMYSTVNEAYNNVDVVELHGENWLRMRRTGVSPDPVVNGAAQLIYNAGHYTVSEANPAPRSIPTINPANQLSDFSGSVILGWSSLGDSHGVILRSIGPHFTNSATTGVVNAYYLAATTSGLGLYYNVGNNFHTSGDELAHAAWETTPGVLNDSNNNQYLLEFSAIGLTISGSLWETDGNGNKVGEDPLAALSYLDLRPNARTEGYFGLRGGRYGSTRSSYFRDLEINVIPEPSAIVFFAFASGWALCRRSRWQKQG